MSPSAATFRFVRSFLSRNNTAATYLQGLHPLPDPLDLAVVRLLLQLRVLVWFIPDGLQRVHHPLGEAWSV